MLFYPNFSHEDRYGGRRVYRKNAERMLRNYGAVDEDLCRRLSPNRGGDFFDLVCEKAISSIIKSGISVIIFRVILGIPFVGVTLFLLAASLPGVLDNPSSGGFIMSVFIIGIFACSGILPIVGAVRFARIRRGLKNGDYESGTLKIEAKYSYDNDGNEYYIVLNNVWVEVDHNIYRNVNLGDNVVCFIVPCGGKKYFVASDTAMRF